MDLLALSWTGLVWDLRAPPEAILKGEKPVGRKVLEKVAADLAASFSVERYAAGVREAWAESQRQARGPLGESVEVEY